MATRTQGQAPGTTEAGGPGGDMGSLPQALPDMDALYNRLAEADEAGDTAALTALAWELYSLAGLLMADRHSLRAELQQALATEHMITDDRLRFSRGHRP